MTTYLITLILFGVFFGCNFTPPLQNDANNQTTAYAYELAIKNGNSYLGKEFRRQLDDSLKSWIKNVNVEFMEGYKERTYEVGTPVLFNSDGTKGIGIIIQYRNEGEVNDFAQKITAQKIDGVWEFYYLGNFSILFTNCDDCPKRFNRIPKDKIEYRAVSNIVQMGYFKEGHEINDEKFNTSWVTDRMKDDHYHKFLTGTYPKRKE